MNSVPLCSIVLVLLVSLIKASTPDPSTFWYVSLSLSLTKCTNTTSNVRRYSVWTDPQSGEKFDLQRMAKGRGWVVKGSREAENEVYYTNICTEVTHKCDKSKVSGPAVATQFGDNVCEGTMGVVTKPKWSLIKKNDPSYGVQVLWGGGDDCGQVGDRQVLIQVRCNSGLSSTRTVSGTEPEMCHYVLAFEGPDGCPGFDASEGGSGWTFIIFIIFGFSAYCGLGVLYNTKYNNLKGAEAIPNSKFWKEFPDLVKEGCQFSYVKAMEMKNKYYSGGNYGYDQADFNDIDEEETY